MNERVWIAPPHDRLARCGQKWIGPESGQEKDEHGAWNMGHECICPDWHGRRRTSKTEGVRRKGDG